jgi:acetyltransferase-like isoleucine patch superfamily enzyme
LAKKFITHGKPIFVGPHVRLYAPHHIRLGNNVRIQSYVHIEANCTIGDYCSLASRVALIGRVDYDFRTIGVPFNLATWVGANKLKGAYIQEKDEVTIEEDVWVGHQSIILTGVRVRRGTVIAAGSVVIRDTEPYSIVAGVPARKVGERFTKEQIAIHERKIATGTFRYSLRGYEHYIVKPGE